MRTPNTIFDIYLDNRLPPAAPDVAGQSGHLRDVWRQGNEANEGGRSFFYTNVLEVPLGVNLPEAYPSAPGSTTIWVPDQNGQSYRVLFVERERSQRGNDFLRAYLVKGVIMAITVQGADGSPTLTDVTTLIFDQADGFSVSQPAANQARIDLTVSTYTDEQAQDAVGSILTDSASIDFTYDDSANTITAIVKDDSITFAKMQNLSANVVIGATTTGDPVEITCTSVGRALLDDADAAAQRTTLGLGTLATASSVALSDIPSTPGTSSFSPTAVPTWIKVTKSYSDFSAAATTKDIEIYSLPAGGVVHQCLGKHSASFVGTGIFGYTIGLGVTGTLNLYWSSFNVFPAPASNGFKTATGGIPLPQDFTSATSVRAQATSTGANLNAATAGSIDIWLLVSKAG